MAQESFLTYHSPASGPCKAENAQRSFCATKLAKPLLAIGLSWFSTATWPQACAQSDDSPMDYMVQNVCLDPAGYVLPISPLDEKCVRQRDLRVGEPLPYHKHDWPALSAASDHPQGYQRGDSLPVSLNGIGVVALHTFDFGDGVRKFGVYDGVNGDGLSLVSVQGDYFGSLMTMDRSGGVQLFVNTDKCNGTVTLDSVEAGWIFGPVNLTQYPSGSLQTHIRRVSNLGVACPAKFTYSTTVWYFADFRPMIAPATEGRRSLRTLVSEHYAGPDSAHFKNVERMYFSRELGRMRWERWQNSALQRRDDDEQRSKTLLDQGRCVGGVGAPRYTGNWVRVACREWTNIVPASNPQGDSIGGWLAPIIRANGGTPLGLLTLP